MNFFKDKKTTYNNINIDEKSIPQHIAIIMDGNGRWAKRRLMPRSVGHKAGVEALRDVIDTASTIGLKFLTLYAFSTENWKRSTEEVSTLMQLLVDYLQKEIHELHRNNVRINTIGDIDGLPSLPRQEVYKAIQLTKDNKGLTVNIALNYGGRDEIIRTVKKIVLAVEDHQLVADDINIEILTKYLDTAAIPDPDLLIRTSGEYRISNFLLWQLAYTEFYFTDVLWPDFRGKDLLEAIISYQKRERRYGRA